MMRWRVPVSGVWRWALTALAAGVVVLWAATARKDGEWCGRMGLRAVGVGDGAVVAAWVPRWWVEKLVANVRAAPALPPGEAGERIVRNFRSDLEESLAGQLETVARAVGSTESFGPRLGMERSRGWAWAPETPAYSGMRAVGFSLRTPLLLAAVPAALLWWPRVRGLLRKRPGCAGSVGTT